MNGEDLEAAHRYRIVPPERVRFMPGIGIDRNAYSQQAASAEAVAKVRRELGLAPESPLFLMIAEMNANKRHPDILHALARLRRKDVHLALAGSGPMEIQLGALARTLGIERQVHFLGFRSDIPALIGACAATLLPSAREGLPRSIMEAFCLERPCIGSDIRGIRDLIGNEFGKLVPVGDIDGFAAAMNWVLEHPAEVQRMGRAAGERMRAYDLSEIIRLHEELYATALGAPGAVSLKTQSAEPV